MIPPPPPVLRTRSARERARLPRAGSIVAGLSCAAAALLSGCDFLRGYASGRSEAIVGIEAAPLDSMQRGQLRFLYDDLNGLNTDTLETNALPWKVTVAALLVYQARGEERSLDIGTLNPLLQRYGFFVPDEIENWKAPGSPGSFDRPLGIVTGRIQRRLPSIALEVANLGCAACHGGVLYDEQGQPLKRAWLGLPNTSINLEGYTRLVYVSLQYAARDPAGLLSAVDQLFPGIDEVERRTLRKYVLPRVEKRLASLAQTLDAPTPFSNGGPGLTNGVAALKLQLGVIPPDSPSDEYGFTSIPDLGGVLLRSALLYDGAYAPPGAERFALRVGPQISDREILQAAKITTFFTVPTMGVPPATAERTIPRVAEIFRFVGRYEPPVFPGSVDRSLAARGGAVYQQHCAVCHGEFSDGTDHVTLLSYPNHLSLLDDIGTDPSRANAIDSLLVDAIADSRFAAHVAARRTGGYVAPRLTALWATAPYLHNGSVPTLWHLMNPGMRPKKFYVGGHKLDFEHVGIAGETDDTGTFRYPPDHTPWSEPVLFDTAEPGLSNEGHEKEFAAVADPAVQRALLEYLKLL